MAYAFQAHVAWGGGDFVNRLYEAGDVLNQLHSAISISNSAALNEVLVNPLGGADFTLIKDFSERGTWYWNVDAPSSNTFAGLSILTDGTDFQLTTTNNNIYTFQVWFKGVGFTAGQQVRVRLWDSTGGLSGVNQLKAVVVTGDWQLVEVSAYVGVDATAGELYLSVQKNGIAADRTILVSGLFLDVRLDTLPSVTFPDNYNSGSAYIAQEDVSERIKSASWELGANIPYQQTSDDRYLNLVLDNTDQALTPEVTTVLTGQIVPGRWVEMSYTDGTNTVIMWRGFLDEISLDWGEGEEAGKITARLVCKGFKQSLDNMDMQTVFKSLKLFAEAREVLQTDFTADVYLQSICEAVGLPYSLETGEITLGQYGDSPNLKIWEAVKDLATAEIGRFFVDRGGTAQFYNRIHTYTAAGTVDSTGTVSGAYKARDIDYVYGALHSNHVTVEANPRKTGGTVTVWEHDSTVTVNAGDTLELYIRLRRDEGQYVASDSLTKSGLTFSSGTATVTVTPSGGQALLNIDNSAGTVAAVMTGLTISGAYKNNQNQVYYLATDQDSIDVSGIRNPVNINLAAFTDLDELRDYATYELGRRALTGHVLSVTFQQKMDGTVNANQLDWTLGDKLVFNVPEFKGTVQYNANIIGERHDIVGTQFEHVTTYYLEPEYIA